MKICIDPGHSGPFEPGVCAAGYTEADLNMSIACQLGDQLNDAGYEVVFTRNGNIDHDSLVFRSNIANAILADIFISIHCNGAGSILAQGVETYCYPGSDEGFRLASLVQTELASLSYTHDRGVKEANFAVLRLTDMPAVLVECGFLTSEKDREVLIDATWQKRIASAIVSGIETYLL